MSPNSFSKIRNHCQLDNSTKLDTPRQIKKTPKLQVSTQLQRQEPQHDPDAVYYFQYTDKHHPDIPHIVKFSGGRSSGMLLLILLENRILKADRGDVVIFNNTSCEHPHTYNFVRECKSITEQYGIPFLMVEFQTYEDARNGEWTRLPAYRLVNSKAWSLDNPNGFHWKGEVFEELLSWSGFVPNLFSRICTKNMKLEATRYFLQDWLACEDKIPYLGHYGPNPRIDPQVTYARHLRNRGSVPKSIYFRKRSYVWNRPHFRQEQKFSDYSKAWQPVEIQKLNGKKYGNKAVFGQGGMEYVALVGLRGDEQVRVSRVRERNEGPDATGHVGEHVYMPLSKMQINKDDVNKFWDQQGWDLDLPKDSHLSNCVFCFLKGASRLNQIHKQMEEAKKVDIPGYGSIKGTPCDIEWWVHIEKIYGRDLLAENREIRSNDGIDFLGFFGARSGFSYELLSSTKDNELN